MIKNHYRLVDFETAFLSAIVDEDATALKNLLDVDKDIGLAVNASQLLRSKFVQSDRKLFQRVLNDPRVQEKLDAKLIKEVVNGVAGLWRYNPCLTVLLNDDRSFLY
jgi:hypothetical protein